MTRAATPPPTTCLRERLLLPPLPLLLLVLGHPLLLLPPLPAAAAARYLAAAVATARQNSCECPRAALLGCLPGYATACMPLLLGCRYPSMDNLNGQLHPMEWVDKVKVSPLFHLGPIVRERQCAASRAPHARLLPCATSGALH